VHIGNHPNQGHYVTLVRGPGVPGAWLMLDDDLVETVTEDDFPLFFGFTDDQLATGKVSSPRLSVSSKWLTEILCFSGVADGLSALLPSASIIHLTYYCISIFNRFLFSRQT
jgi:hypothetical protein